MQIYRRRSQSPLISCQGRWQKVSKDGHPTWTEKEIDQYQRVYPLGTRERVWLDVLLYTGTRISDAVLLSDKLLNERGMISWDTVKTDTRVDMPVLKILRTTLDAGPPLPDAWIVGPSGRRLTSGRARRKPFVEAATRAAVGITKSRARGSQGGGLVALARAGRDELRRLGAVRGDV